MSASHAPKTGLDNASSINAFLSRISPAAKPHPSSTKSEDVVERAGEPKLSDDDNADATGTRANGAAVGATDSTAMETIARPEPELAGTLPADSVSDGIHLNTPPDHSVFKNVGVAGVQAQESPQVSGVRAPPPTPETVSSLAIGRLFMDVLEHIPQDRMLSLGDSIHAPKNHSKLRYNRSAAASQSQNQFFSPVPQSSKPREDADFTRMSFKAAATPSPRLFSLPSPGRVPVTGFQLTGQGQPSAATSAEDTHLGKPVGTIGDAKAPQADKPNVATATVKGSETYSSSAPNAPPPPPRLKPAIAEDVRASKVKTPDVPDRPLDSDVKGLADIETPLQPRYARVQPFSADYIPGPRKEVENVKENAPAPQLAIRKRLASVAAGGLEVGTPVGGLLTPASVDSGAVSTRGGKAAGATAASMPGKGVGEDLEGALYFKAWPKLEERGTRTAARVRKIMLVGIPSGATPNLVASFVFGGPLERIHVADSSAFVTFLRGEDAAKYYEATGNGLDYKKDGVQHVIVTEMTSEVNPVGGILREYIEKEFTRCVRAIGVGAEWTAMALHELAAPKGRKVEKIVDGLNASKASALEPTKRRSKSKLTLLGRKDALRQFSLL
ncbi:hypothetical protein XPA_006551 [Xanthoria parietina]